MWGTPGLLIQYLDVVPEGWGAPSHRCCAVSATSVESLRLPGDVPTRAGCLWQLIRSVYVQIVCAVTFGWWRLPQSGGVTDECAERQIFSVTWDTWSPSRNCWSCSAVVAVSGQVLCEWYCSFMFWWHVVGSSQTLEQVRNEKRIS